MNVVILSIRHLCDEWLIPDLILTLSNGEKVTVNGAYIAKHKPKVGDLFQNET